MRRGVRPSVLPSFYPVVSWPEEKGFGSFGKGEEEERESGKGEKGESPPPIVCEMINLDPRSFFSPLSLSSFSQQTSLPIMWKEDRKKESFVFSNQYQNRQVVREISVLYVVFYVM